MTDIAERRDRPGYQRARRVSHWGQIIIGFLAIILSINAALESNYTGSGVLLGASALAFGFLGYTFGRD